MRVNLDRISSMRKAKYHHVNIQENLLTSRDIGKKEEIVQAYHLRHEVFAKELR